MARLKTTVRQAASIPDMVPGVVAQKEVGAISGAEKLAGGLLAKTGQSVRRESQTAIDRIDRFQGASANIALQKEALKINAEVRDIADHNQWEPEYAKRMKVATDRVGKDIESGDMRVQFGSRASSLAGTGGERIRVAAEGRENKFRQAQLLGDLDDGLKNAVNALDNDARKAAFEDAHTMIDETIRKYGLDARTGFAVKEKWLKDFSSGMAASLTPAALVQMFEGPEGIRRVVNGKIVYDKNLNGTFLDFIPNDQKEAMYQAAKAKGSGQTLAFRSQGVADDLRKMAKKKGWSETKTISMAEKQSTYRNYKKGWSAEEMAEIRDHTVGRLTKSFVAINKERAVKFANRFGVMTKKNGNLQDRETIITAIKTHVTDPTMQRSVIQMFNVDRDRQDGLEVDSKYATIIGEIKPGETLDETLALTESMRPGVKEPVAKKIRDHFKLQREAEKTADADRYKGVLKIVDDGGMPSPEQLKGLTPTQQTHATKLAEFNAFRLANKNYARPNTRDGVMDFREATKDITKFLNLTREQLREKFEMKVSQDFWDTKVLPAWGGEAGGKGNAGLTEVKRVEGAFNDAGGGSDDDEIRFSQEYHRRITQFGAKTIKEEDVILAQMSKEKFILDSTGPDTIGGIWKMDKDDREEMASEMDIPDAEHEAFGAALPRMIRDLAQEGYKVNRGNIKKVWPKYKGK